MNYTSNAQQGQPTQQEVNEIKSHLATIQSKYFATVTPLYTVAECSLNDTWTLARQCKAKGVWRMILHNAYNEMRKEGVDIQCKRCLCKGYDLLLDVGDALQERLKTEFAFGKIAINNAVINATTKDAALKTLMLYTAWTYEICTVLHDTYFADVKNNYHHNYAAGFTEFRQSKVNTLIHRVCESFCTDCFGAIERAKPEIRKCENAIFNKIFSENFLNLTIREAMIANGEYADIVKRVDSDMAKEEEAKLGLDKLEEKYTVKKSRKIRH